MVLLASRPFTLSLTRWLFSTFFELSCDPFLLWTGPNRLLLDDASFLCAPIPRSRPELLAELQLTLLKIIAKKVWSTEFCPAVWNLTCILNSPPPPPHFSHDTNLHGCMNINLSNFLLDVRHIIPHNPITHCQCRQTRRNYSKYLKILSGVDKALLHLFLLTVVNEVFPAIFADNRLFLSFCCGPALKVHLKVSKGKTVSPMRYIILLLRLDICKIGT
jgi:hypothetical protein